MSACRAPLHVTSAHELRALEAVHSGARPGAQSLPGSLVRRSAAGALGDSNAEARHALDTAGLASRWLRLARRRWRPWWRYQLRVVRWRRPFRWFKSSGAVDGGLPTRALALRTGRLAGRAYLAGVTGLERLRIARARLPDRIEPTRSAVALARSQRGFVTYLFVLVVAGLLVDEGARRAWKPVLGRVGAEHWVRANVSGPSPQTLRDVLAASAVGTATILGLVVSISLIAWQTTATRYHSSSIVGFLLRERMGSALVRLLALAFTYSLWLLTLLEVFHLRPYVSTGFALVLSTLAVVSLPSYRQLGLLGALPRSISRGLREEMVREFARAQRRGAGRSVEYYSRPVVAADLQIFDDLLRQLLDDGDLIDAAVSLEELEAALAAYLTVKSRFRSENLFFVQREERLGGAGYVIEERVSSQGLMDPMTTTPDHLWLERRALEVVDLVLASAALDNREVAKRVIRLWATALQLAWHREDQRNQEKPPKPGTCATTSGPCVPDSL